MITPSSSIFRPRTARQGLALVVTVSMIALMMVLLLALLNTSKDNYQAEQMVTGKSQAKLVAQQAVHVALAQVRVATEQTFASGRPKPWTSQPGAVRVHNMDGSLHTLFKLYSSNQMTSDSLAALEPDVPDNWATRPDDFVDLNEPWRGPDGDLRFPIADPRAYSTDPLTSVEGFSYLPQKGAVGPEAGDAMQQRLPMPVRWMYVLKDGSIGTLSAAGQFEGAGEIQPSRTNPIVSRFAFWVDDETSKVNVNTASEGSFWDTPRADTSQERTLAKNIPSRLEYMRQPGHPAGVSLSSVLLPNRRLAPLGFPIDSSSAMRAMDSEDARDLWRLGRLTVAERLDNTSRGGTVETDWASLWVTAPTESVRQPRYADIHELIFDNASKSRFPSLWQGESNAPSNQRRGSRLFKEHPESLSLLKKSHFFLTTQNAAPEVTLFGTPRVAAWAISDNTIPNGSTLGLPQDRDTLYSHKLAMTSMVKGRPYIVQRSDPGNGISDYAMQAGSSNKALFEYLQSLTNSPFPGYERASQNGSTFAGKYGEDRDAILIEMMDYLRSSNFAESQLDKKLQFSVLCPGAEHHGFGQVSPLQLTSIRKPPTTSRHIQGLGRMATISEVALIITCRAEVGPDGQVHGEPTGSVTDDPLTDEDDAYKLKNPGDRQLDVGFLVETFLPTQGWTDYRPFVTVALVGGKPGAALDPEGDDFPAFTLNGVRLEKDTHRSITDELPPQNWYGGGGGLGVRNFKVGTLQFKPILIKAKPNETEPPKLSFTSAPDEPNQLKIALYDEPTELFTRESLLQVVPLKLPDISEEANIRLPAHDATVGSADLASRMIFASDEGKPLLAATDVVQSVAPLHGDYRLTALQRWAESPVGGVNTPVFSPHPQWGKQRLAHNLRDWAQIIPVDLTQQQGYVQGLRQSPQYLPDIPDHLGGQISVSSRDLGAAAQPHSSSVSADSLRLDGGRRGSALPAATGDFDNGTGNTPDGPYSNRPDDGHWAAVVSGNVPYFDNVSQTGTTVPPVSVASFSPQRLVPSPVMFGSLPTGARAQVPWQTLLFRPHAQHYGAETPPDHLLLDLFWTPVLEPEPLSKYLETEGKINLNHQILPFRHITRATALHAAMKAETLMAIPDTASETYKSGVVPSDRFRHHVDAKQTLGLWQQEVFDQGQVFLTAGQICEQYLVPESLTGSGNQITRTDMENFWRQHRLTGDNSKERPYAHLYSRLTTRSNTYRVHFVAQSLVKARSTPVGTFDSRRDKVAGTHAGSAVISRQLDLENPDLPDYQATTTAKPLDKFYRWSIGRMDANSR